MNRLQRHDFPGPTEPLSFSPPERPTTEIEISLGGPELAPESPRRNVKPGKRSYILIELVSAYMLSIGSWGGWVVPHPFFLGLPPFYNVVGLPFPRTFLEV